MSQTVLGDLRRGVDTLLRAVSPDRSTGEVSATLRPDGGEREDEAHLRDVPDGAGCTEIWEHLSERQASGPEATADD